MLTTVEKVLTLKNVALFREIPGEVLADIAFLLDEVNFDRGTYIVTEGEVGTELFVVVSGKLDALTGGHKVAEFVEGDYFGEMAIIDSQTRSATVIAMSDVTLLRIDKNDFYDILSQREEVAIGIIKVLSQRIRELNQKVTVQ